MRLLAVISTILLLSSISFSFMHYVDFWGEKQSGTGKSLNYSVLYNCTDKIFYIWVTDGPKPVEGASAFLFYGDYSYQLVATDTTDSNGMASLSMIGNEKLIRNIFTLRLEKSGYKTDEVQIVINCSKTYSSLPPQAQNATNSSTQSNQTSVINATANTSSGFNTSSPQTNFSQQNSSSGIPSSQPGKTLGGAAPASCLPAAALCVLGLFIVFYSQRR